LVGRGGRGPFSRVGPRGGAGEGGGGLWLGGVDPRAEGPDSLPRKGPWGARGAAPLAVKKHGKGRKPRRERKGGPGELSRIVRGSQVRGWEAVGASF